MPTQSATAVAVQYRSPQFGAVRVVRCDAPGLTRWLKLHAAKFGGKARFEELLDLSAPIARRAMRPS